MTLNELYEKLDEIHSCHYDKEVVVIDDYGHKRALESISINDETNEIVINGIVRLKDENDC